MDFQSAQRFFLIQLIGLSPWRSLLQGFLLNDLLPQGPRVDLEEELKAHRPDLEVPLAEWSEAARLLACKESDKPNPLRKRILYGDPLYPENFYKMEDPPWALSIWGEPVWRTHRLLSVVGSRECSSKSLLWMQDHLPSFIDQRWSLVSGGARGVDQEAHGICIRKRRPTVVFLPSGLNQLYPRALNSWRAAIQESGSCFVSEFPDDFEVRKYAFSFRNRLIAALGEALLVVEARDKSGSLMTGHIALEMGRCTFTLPTHPRDLGSVGNLKLLELGAQWVRGASDLSEYLDYNWVRQFPSIQPVGALDSGNLNT